MGGVFITFAACGAVAVAASAARRLLLGAPAADEKEEEPGGGGGDGKAATPAAGAAVASGQLDEKLERVLGELKQLREAVRGEGGGLGGGALRLGGVGDGSEC